MNPHLFPRRAVIAALLIMSTVHGVPLSAGQIPSWLGGGDKDTKYKTYKDPAGRFELDYPTKDWRLLPSAGSNLAVLSGKDGPSLFIELTKLTDSLTPAEVEAMPDLELSRVKDQQPKATDFKSEMLDSKSGRGVLIRYSRVAVVPEVVVQYSIPVLKDLYRLNAVIPARIIAKQEAVVMHMIQSFMAAAGPPTTQPR